MDSSLSRKHFRIKNLPQDAQKLLKYDALMDAQAKLILTRT